MQTKPEQHVQNEAASRAIAGIDTMSVTVRGNGTEFTHQFRPEWVRSYCQAQVPYGLDHSEQIHVAGIGTAVTLFVNSCQARSYRAEAIQMGQLPSIRVHKAIVGIRLIIYERGWPHESPRRTIAEHRYPDDGIPEYSQTYKPEMVSPGIRLFNAGWHTDREIESIGYHHVKAVKQEGHRVELDVDKEGRRSKVTFLATDDETAGKLATALREKTVEMIEINDSINGIISEELSPTFPMTWIFGFENLRVEDQKPLLDAGARSPGRDELSSNRPFYSIVPPMAARPN